MALPGSLQDKVGSGGRKFHFQQASPGFHSLHCYPDVQKHVGNAAVDAGVVNVGGSGGVDVDVAGDARATAVEAHSAVFHENIRRCDIPGAAYATEGDAAAGHAHTTLCELMLVAVSEWMTELQEMRYWRLYRVLGSGAHLY